VRGDTIHYRTSRHADAQNMPTTLAKNLRADSVSKLPLRDVCSVEPSETIQNVVRLMNQRRVGCALVIRGGKELIGIFTERDFLSRVVAQGLDVKSPVEKVKKKTQVNNAQK
jgi:CBS domain-containing protein